MATRKQVALIAAACKGNGIGVKGDLPWRLKNEMAFFTRTTKTTMDQNKVNAVIMGRRTWDCIPPKFRPLRGRVNVVLSQNLAETPEGADYLFASLPTAIEELQSNSNVEKLFIIGGERVYKDAMDLLNCSRVYLTRIDAEFECDAFFPEMDMTQFVEVVDATVPTGLQEENGLKFQYYVYEKISK